MPRVSSREQSLTTEPSVKIQRVSCYEPGLEQVRLAGVDGCHGMSTIAGFAVLSPGYWLCKMALNRDLFECFLGL